MHNAYCQNEYIYIYYISSVEGKRVPTHIQIIKLILISEHA